MILWQVEFSALWFASCRCGVGKLYSGLFEQLDFARGISCGVIFYHAGRDISLVVHGDDLTAMGLKGDLDWYETELAKSFKLKIRGRLGEDCDLKEM